MQFPALCRSRGFGGRSSLWRSGLFLPLAAAWLLRVSLGVLVAAWLLRVWLRSWLYLPDIP